MKTEGMKWITKVMMMLCMFAVLQACNPSGSSTGKSETEFQITDAPSDDDNVRGVFVTIRDIKVDGYSVPGFKKQTINLKAYQEGSTRSLGTALLDAKKYNELTLVLDTETDVDGGAPGCYVLTYDNVKHTLGDKDPVEILVKDTWHIAPNSKSTFVLDFDLRKMISHGKTPGVGYSFVSNKNLHDAVRLINRENSGTINGFYSEKSTSGSDKIIVYAYPKGGFDKAVETTPSSGEGIIFKNSLASAEVRSGLLNETFKLVFLEEGNYELYFASYKKDLATERFVFQSLLSSITTATTDGTPTNEVIVTNGSIITANAVIGN